MTISDVLIILATLCGPVLAVQSQKWIERSRERRHAQKDIFYRLMATRATRLATDHVQALNMIDIEFGGHGRRSQSQAEREVVNRWRIYADHLNTPIGDNPPEAQVAIWVQRGDELFTDLLAALATALGYGFDRIQLRRGIYHPKGHSDQEIRQETAQKALLDILVGRSALPMKVVEFPVSDDALELQTKVHEAFLATVSNGAITVKRAE